MIRLAVDATRPDPLTIERAALIVREGGVVAIPTDTLYGLAGDPFNAATVARLFGVKGRGGERALPLVAASAEQVRACLGEMPALGARLARAFWPGPLTLLMPVPDSLPPRVTGGAPTVGVRVPAHAVTRALCLAAGKPLTATSANISGEPATDDPDVVAASLGGSIDLLLDAGRTPGGPASTIVDVTGVVPVLVRVGAIRWDEVIACAQGR